MPDYSVAFLEQALAEKLLTPEQANFCRESLHKNRTALHTVIEEGFLSANKATQLYEKVLEREGQPQSLKVLALQEDEVKGYSEIEEKFLELALEEELLNEEDLQFCQRELERLNKEGYFPQIPALLYSMRYLTREKLLELYEKVTPEFADKVVSKEVASFELALPQLRKRMAKKKKSAIAEKVSATMTPDQVAMLEKTSKLIPNSEFDEDHAPVSEETDKQIEEAMSPQKETPAEESQPHKVATGNKDQTEDLVLESLFNDKEQAQGLTHSIRKLARVLLEEHSKQNSQEEYRSLTFEEREEEIEEQHEQIDIERKNFRQKLPACSQAELQKVLKKGGKIEKKYIPKLHFQGETLTKKLTFVDCAIETMDFSQAKLEAEVDFSGSEFFDKVIFRDSSSQKDVVFRKCTFHTGADFSKAEFSGKANFNTASFRRFANFNRSQFAKKVVFTRSSFAKGAKFGDVTFASGASFNDIYIDHRFYMEKCKLEAESTFSGARFSDMADFSRTSFVREINFKGTVFGKWAKFNYCKFLGPANFNTMHALGDLAFDGAVFEDLINLKAVCGERNVSFQGVKLKEHALFSFIDAYFGRLFISQSKLQGRLYSEQQEDYKTARKEYGLLKNNFREINEYESEDWAYLMEKRMERKSINITGPITALKRFLHWSALDLSCGYGTSPLRIFLTSLVILLCFGVFYLTVPNEFVPSGDLAYPRTIIENQAEKFSPIEAIQVSFRIFTNASVEGWVPYTDSWVNYVMMLESFLGFFVMTILVVTFSRKVIR